MRPPRLQVVDGRTAPPFSSRAGRMTLHHLPTAKAKHRLAVHREKKWRMEPAPVPLHPDCWTGLPGEPKTGCARLRFSSRRTTPPPAPSPKRTQVVRSVWSIHTVMTSGPTIRRRAGGVGQTGCGRFQAVEKGAAQAAFRSKQRVRSSSKPQLRWSRQALEGWALVGVKSSTRAHPDIRRCNPARFHGLARRGQWPGPGPVSPLCKKMAACGCRGYGTEQPTRRFGVHRPAFKSSLGHTPGRQTPAGGLKIRGALMAPPSRRGQVLPHNAVKHINISVWPRRGPGSLSQGRPARWVKAASTVRKTAASSCCGRPPRASPQDAWTMPPRRRSWAVSFSYAAQASPARRSPHKRCEALGERTGVDPRAPSMRPGWLRPGARAPQRCPPRRFNHRD